MNDELVREELARATLARATPARETPVCEARAAGELVPEDLVELLLDPRPADAAPPHSTALVGWRAAPLIEHHSEAAELHVMQLEPASPPSFSIAIGGYRRGQVDEYCENLRRRLAAMRHRARTAEQELMRLQQLGSQPDLLAGSAGEGRSA